MFGRLKQFLNFLEESEESSEDEHVTGSSSLSKMREDFRFDGNDHGDTGNGKKKKYTELSAEEVKQVKN